jgi:hypothetical protein
VVGINHYEKISPLYGCANDAQAVHDVLAWHGHGGPNFGVKLLTATSSADAISRSTLKKEIEALFADDSDIALLYFAGHGYVESLGGYLCTSDCESGDDGLALSDVLGYANASSAKNRIIILDSCHSGVAAKIQGGGQVSQLTEGLTVLTASTEKQYANEADGSGIFTTLLIDALGGAAANLVGDVTPGSVYAHIDQSLGPWEQRPVFKTNVKNFVSLREVDAPIPPVDLRRMAEFFPEPGVEFALDPEFEPERAAGDKKRGIPDPDPEKNKLFAILQKYNRVNLLVPVDAPHMWHAAMNSKSCRLTPLGEHYRRLVAEGRI